MAQRLLLVEDDPNLVVTLTDALGGEGFSVESFGDGAAAVNRAVNESFDAILLDVTIPGGDGYEVCGQLRRLGVRVPVLMVTGRAELEDKVKGFDAGADDYLTKPFDVKELMARIRALLRRAEAQRIHGLWEYRFGAAYVEFFGGTLIRNGARLSLSGKELQLLRYLIAHKGHAVSRAELLEKVWGYQGAVTRTVDVHIASLRQKVEDDPQNPRHILTVRREGYLFQD